MKCCMHMPCCHDCVGYLSGSDASSQLGLLLPPLPLLAMQAHS